MPYELAKQLQDAGFPLKTLEEVEAEKVYLVSNQGKGYRRPTLEELIEACVAVKLLPYGKYTEVKWTAEGGKLDGQVFVMSYYGGGATPAEAVARLWLVLNPTPTRTQE